MKAVKLYSFNKSSLLLSLLFAVIVPFIGATQVANYVFTETTGTYQTVNPPAGQGISGTFGEGHSIRASMTVPFEFCIGGTMYSANSLAINQYQNGFISFGATGGTVNAANSRYPLTNFNNIMCAFGDKLQTTGTSSVGWRLIGTAPNRVIVFQWGQSVLGNNGSGTPASNNYWRRVYDGHSNDRLHFQIRLYETTNVIEFHYLIIPHPSQNNAGLITNAQVGIRLSATDFNVRTKLAGGLWNSNTSVASALPTAIPTSSNTIPFNNQRNNATNNRPSASTTPANANAGTGTGTIFRWTPVGGPSAPEGDYSGCYFSPLPVELTKFSVEALNRVNQIIWTTATEQNSDYFIVERSLNGAEWDYVGQVKSAGSSSITIHYNLEDGAFEKTINYYRLKQVDFDGTTKIYNMVSVDNRITKSDLVKIVNTLGQEVNEFYKGLVIEIYSDGTTQKYYKH